MKIILTQSGRKQKFEIFLLLRSLAYIFQKHETQNDFKRSIELSNEIGHHETNLWIISGAQFTDKFLLKLFSCQIILFSISDSVSDVYICHNLKNCALMIFLEIGCFFLRNKISEHIQTLKIY